LYITVNIGVIVGGSISIETKLGTAAGGDEKQEAAAGGRYEEGEEEEAWPAASFLFCCHMRTAKHGASDLLSLTKRTCLIDGLNVSGLKNNNVSIPILCIFLLFGICTLVRR
jgi:hypothetical protein